MFCHLKLKSKMVICAAAVMNEVSRRLIISHGRQFLKKMFVRKIWIVFVGFYSLEWWFSDENRDRAWWLEVSPRVFLLPTCGYVLVRSAICGQNNFWYFKKFWNSRKCFVHETNEKWIDRLITMQHRFVL